jgi:predicted HicB family RNase H-like nuclease
MAEELKKTRDCKRFVIEIPDEFHCEIKQRAAKRGISIKLWVLRAIKKSALDEDKYLKE